VRFPSSVRWVAVTIFIFSSVLNYLDRQVLATMAEIWRAHPAFPFTYGDYGSLLSVFSIAYAVSALFIGWFIDRVGLNRGATIAVAIWGVASFGTGMSHNVHQLLIWRAVLGVAEAGGVSAALKAVAMYLLPEERALGGAVGQLGLSLGAGLAPGFAVYFSYQYDWRWTFFAAGILSFIWIPAWLTTARLIPSELKLPNEPNRPPFRMLADRTLWALMLANALGMTAYSLWTNWSPSYLVRMHHLTPAQAAGYVWIIPICGYFGAMLGGAISWFLIRSGMTPVAARKRACLISACFALATFAIPALPTPALATFGISFSYFWVCSWSTNHYTLPIDIYGPGQAAFGVAGLVFAYGAMQSIVSQPIAAVIQRYGFEPVCFLFALLPLMSYLVVHLMIREKDHSLREKKFSTHNQHVHSNMLD
jgi:MFS transporter, ACS family, aldohexuronate transporter